MCAFAGRLVLGGRPHGICFTRSKSLACKILDIMVLDVKLLSVKLLNDPVSSKYGKYKTYKTRY